MADVLIRDARCEDANAISRIYAYYVEHTAITFDCVGRTAQAFAEKIVSTQQSYPFLAAEDGGEVVGFAYASRFRPQTAYAACVELSIYLDKDYEHRGIGKALYAELEARLAAQGITNLYACISCPIEPDEYLDTNSIDFHAHLGFTTVGRFHACGKKFQRVYDMVWMEKLLV